MLICVVSDKLMIPVTRFRNSAYDTSANVSRNMIFVSAYRAPNLTTSFEFFESLGDMKKIMHIMKEFTPEDVKTYAAMLVQLAEQGVKICIGSVAEIVHLIPKAPFFCCLSAQKGGLFT